MKRIETIILPLLLLATACRNDAADSAAVAHGDAVRFSSAAATTRTDISEQEGALEVVWNRNDEVGIFGERGGRSIGGNYAYAAVPDEAEPGSCTFSPLSSRRAFYDAAAGDLYCAVWPYSASAGDDPRHVALSLDAVQYQRTSGDMSHLPRHAAMAARPVTVEQAENDVAFDFYGLFSIVELRLRLTDDSSIDRVPLKKVAMVSSGADLAFSDGSADITSFTGQGVSLFPVETGEGSRSVALMFDEETALTKDYAAFYMVVATGSHPSGDITLEVTAIDNSVCSISLPGDVLFSSNRRYVKSVEIPFDGFVMSDPFDVETEKLTVGVGEPVKFVFSGVADRIVFWSGETGHEYRYSKKGRPADVSLRFESLYYNGLQRECATVKYSPDFRLAYDGTAVASTEADIEKATWYDVSDRFVLPPYITNIDPEANPINQPYDSGTVDISDWFTEENDAVTFGFFYHVEKYDADYVDEKTGKKGKGRTWFNIYSLLASARFDGGGEPSTLVEMKKGDHTQLEIIHGESYADEPESQHCKKNVSSGGTTVIRCQATYQAKADRFAYVVTKPIVRPHAAPDSGATVKEDGQQQPETYEYAFAEAGVYKVAVVGTVATLEGDKEVVKEFEITVEQ